MNKESKCCWCLWLIENANVLACNSLWIHFSLLLLFISLSKSKEQSGASTDCCIYFSCVKSFEFFLAVKFREKKFCCSITHFHQLNFILRVYKTRYFTKKEYFLKKVSIWDFISNDYIREIKKKMIDFGFTVRKFWNYGN